MSDAELETTSEFDDEDTMEYMFTDDVEDDFEDATWEWDGTQWQKVA